MSLWSRSSSPKSKPVKVNTMPPELLEENLASLGRMFLISTISLTLAFFGMIWFPSNNPQPSLFGLDWGNMLRYLIVPVGATVLVIMAGARFLQDVYALEGYGQAVNYILSSLFGFPAYPVLVIDDGEPKLKENEVNPLLIFGGPGTILIQPGNAVMFRGLRRRSRHGITSSVFLRRFETIGMIADLEDQEDVIDALKAVTKDGILIEVKGIKYRYRVISNKPKSLDDPYPFLETELDRLAYNISTREQGQPTWRAYIRQSISTYIKEQVNIFTIDDLTAPRTDEKSPWMDIHKFLTKIENIPNISSVGTEIIWVDLGHIHIEPEIVDESRIGFWATDWVGSAEAKMAYATGKRLAYQDQARAEAQAELIMSIAHSLEGINFSASSSENVRKIFLARTAEIINSLNIENNPGMVKNDNNGNR
ncbi:MAG: hypothetical protein LWX83_09130 [Anaerolineae bacterium]|nr:hypothetical protein [Anaerolineae bacterium]